MGLATKRRRRRKKRGRAHHERKDLPVFPSVDSGFGDWFFASLAPFCGSLHARSMAALEDYKLPAMGEVVDLPTIKIICEHYGLTALWQKIQHDPPPKPFKSAGCTGWVNEWKGISIYSAGFRHDLKYWAGYPGEDVDRLVADAELMIDVARLLHSTEMAEVM